VSLLSLRSAGPRVSPTAWVAANATIVGDVELHPDSSVWYSAVLRGDTSPVVLGESSNVQDGSVLHAGITEPVLVGVGVSIGHRAVVHGCTVGDHTLIGMGAIVMTSATIGARSIVAAGSVVTEGMTIPDGCLVVGSPARVRRDLTVQEQAELEMNAVTYVALAASHRDAVSASGGGSTHA
jgi:carbonic anhydrase/acetyltransferase-like protein (isoleucine patch superfamily)